jgi:hypothetical protein
LRRLASELTYQALTANERRWLPPSQCRCSASAPQLMAYQDHIDPTGLAFIEES